ncbi:hypothetical protein INT43_003395 [Umbelopsis isabellina]|uniref:Peroxiredoxin-like 2A n=1 Tax=Mortierella isabellina TaxID=91625 RepID=A0A8H7PQ42_MORIS|nr:hypothetical protein INT43_003395 [Umbelopsis isabellina]
MSASTYNKVNTQYSTLSGISLRKVVEGKASDEVIRADTLWEHSPTLIMVVRRPGCQLCREEAVQLRNNQEEIEDKLKVRMVAVVHEVEGAQIFNDGWWKGDLYFDEDKAFYKALGGGSLQWRSPVRLIMPTGIKTLTKSFLYGEKGNLKGEGRIMGGLYILHKGNNGVAYEYLEKTFGDHAPTEEVLGACKLASDKVKGADTTKVNISEPQPGPKL